MYTAPYVETSTPKSNTNNVFISFQPNAKKDDFFNRIIILFRLFFSVQYSFCRIAEFPVFLCVLSHFGVVVVHTIFKIQNGGFIFILFLSVLSP